MQGMAAVANGYQTASTISTMAGNAGICTLMMLLLHSGQ